MKTSLSVPFLVLACMVSAIMPARVSRGADYFVDADAGADRNNGLSETSAWKSLDPVNAATFLPGDRIFLKAGTHYTGSLDLKGSGTTGPAAKPIELTSFGSGPPARIDAEGKSPAALTLHNVQGWTVHDLEFTNHGNTPADGSTGVTVLCDDHQTRHAIRLTRLFVHDVKGDLRKEHEGCGIFFETRGRNSKFDDYRVEDCHLARTDRNGICQRSTRSARSTGVVIRGNLLEDIGGDGIKLWGSNGGLIENNVIHGGRMRCDDYAAGIWPFACDDTIIQHNEVSGMKGIKDGQGFDSDYLCRNSVFQYNYSHDNDGGFILVCSPGGSYNTGTIIRYNISQNDGRSGSRVFHFAGNSSDSKVYNNVIYVGPNRAVPLLDFDEWSGGTAHRTTFNNNIFYVDGTATYRWGKSFDNVFDHNVFFGNHVAPPKDPNVITQKPPLIRPGGGVDGFKSLACYGVAPGASLPEGAIIPTNGGRDFFSTKIPPGVSPTVGVQQPIR